MNRLNPASLRGLLTATVLTVLTSAAQGTPPETAETADILARVREAMGWTDGDRPAAYRGEGTADWVGLDARYTLQFDSQGRYREQRTARVSQTIGFDGETAWQVGRNGTAWTLELGNREDELANRWIQIGYWLSPQSPFEIELAAAGESDATELSLRLRDGAWQGTLTLDPDTWRPASLRDGGGQDSAEFYSDYREVDGRWFPGTVVSTSKMDLDQSVSLTVLEAAGDDPAAYRPVREQDDDSWIDPDGPAALDVRLAPAGHLLVQAAINDEAPGWWIFDTGAGTTVIDRGLADRVGLEQFGTIILSGVGGPEEAAFRAADVLQLGPLSIEGMIFTEMDCSFLTPAFGVAIEGIIGFEVLHRAIFEVDSAAPAIALHHPDDFSSEGLAWQQLILYDRHPCTPCRFEGGHEGVFRLDTGAGSSTVTFHQPAVETYRLLEGRKVNDSQAGGVGGFVAVKTGKIEYFEIGGHRFDEPRVEFALEDKGAFADATTLGNVGGQFLNQFLLVLDYHGQRIAFADRGAPE